MNRDKLNKFNLLQEHHDLFAFKVKEKGTWGRREIMDLYHDCTSEIYRKTLSSILEQEEANDLASVI